MRLFKYLLILSIVAAVAWLYHNDWDFNRSVSSASKESTEIYHWLKKGPPKEREVVVDQAPPENAYFVRERFEYPLNPGVAVFEVGSMVRKTGESTRGDGSKIFMVVQGSQKATVDPDKLTRDPQEIARLRRNVNPRPAPSKAALLPQLQEQLQNVDTKLEQLRSELAKATSIEAAARKNGRPVPIGNNPILISNLIHDAEKSRADLLRKIAEASSVPK